MSIFRTNRANRVFISYRNTMFNDELSNWDIVCRLGSELKEKYGYNCYSFHTLSIPQNALFSAYKAGKFLHETFLEFDVTNHMFILDSLYYDSYGSPTSVWTEAEMKMWSYYGRGGWLNPYKHMDQFYTVATPNSNGTAFSFRQIPLMMLKQETRALFGRTNNVFIRGALIPPPVIPKMADMHFVTCNQCERTYTVREKTLRQYVDSARIFKCSCGTHIMFHVERDFFTSEQNGDRCSKSMDIETLLGPLLLTDRMPFEEMTFN